MAVQILSPQAGSVFTTTETIPVSGINGPITATEVSVAVAQADEAAAGPGAESGSPWSTTVGPITTPGMHTIKVTGPGGRTASVTVTITAANG